MIFSQVQKDFLRNLISFEIIEIQNQFVNCSKFLRNLIINIKDSIKFDEVFLKKIDQSFLNDIIFYKNENEIDDDLYIETSNLDLEQIINSRLFSMKVFLKEELEEKKKIKKILEAAFFLDFYRFFLKKFDILYNIDLIIKISHKFNDKFHLSIFNKSFLLEKHNNIQYNLIDKNQYIKNHETNDKYKNNIFDSKFLNEIGEFCESEICSKYKECNKILSSNNIKFNKKHNFNIQESLKVIIQKYSKYLSFLNIKIINDIQNEIDAFYMNEVFDIY
jgi:hypothetical protein